MNAAYLCAPKLKKRVSSLQSSGIFLPLINKKKEKKFVVNDSSCIFAVRSKKANSSSKNI